MLIFLCSIKKFSCFWIKIFIFQSTFSANLFIILFKQIFIVFILINIIAIYSTLFTFCFYRTLNILNKTAYKSISLLSFQKLFVLKSRKCLYLHYIKGFHLPPTKNLSTIKRIIPTTRNNKIWA